MFSCTQANLPVLLYIHGGFLQFGSGCEQGLCPSSFLAKKLNAVFVSFNFRLHALGFLPVHQIVKDANSQDNDSVPHDHSHSSNSFSSGNFGLYDHVLVLEWIQNNIKAFGGDASSVTVFGPDSAGASIFALLSNPSSSKLFSKAWMMNPSLYLNRSSDCSVNKKVFDSFLTRTQCVNSTCLRNLSPLEVTNAFLGNDDPSFRINDQNDLPIQGIFATQLIAVDGDFVAFPYVSSKEPLRHNLLIGSTAQSIDFWPGPRDLSHWTWDQYVKYVTTSLDSFGPKLSQLALSVYPPGEDASTTQRDLKESVYPSVIQATVSSLKSSSKKDSLPEETTRALNERQESTTKTSLPSTIPSSSPETSTSRGEKETKLEASSLSPEAKSMTNNTLLQEKKEMSDSQASSSSPSLSSTSPEGRKRSVRQIESEQEGHNIIIKTRIKRSMTNNVSSDQIDNSNHISMDKKKSSQENKNGDENGNDSSESDALITTPELLYSSMVSDVRQVCPVNLVTKVISQSGIKSSEKKPTTSSPDHSPRVYRYIVTSTPSSSVSTLLVFSYLLNTGCTPLIMNDNVMHSFCISLEMTYFTDTCTEFSIVFPRLDSVIIFGVLSM